MGPILRNSHARFRSEGCINQEHYVLMIVISPDVLEIHDIGGYLGRMYVQGPCQGAQCDKYMRNLGPEVVTPQVL